MYQTSIRNKKKSSNLNKVSNNNYVINKDYEVFGYVMKVLGNCRVLVLCDNGTEAIGVIRGSMRRFNKRVLIETGDIVAVSMREFQMNKVDIVHKYNAEQCKILIANKEISDTLINAYNKVCGAGGAGSRSGINGGNGGSGGTGGTGVSSCHNTNDVDILFEDTQDEDSNKKTKDSHDAIFEFDSEDDAEEDDDI